MRTAGLAQASGGARSGRDGAQSVRALAHERRPHLARRGTGGRPRSRHFGRGSRRALRRGPTEEVAMTDLSIIVVTAALFGAAFFFVRLCERM
jgi:hypothetical protein